MSATIPLEACVVATDELRTVRLRRRILVPAASLADLLGVSLVDVYGALNRLRGRTRPSTASGQPTPTPLAPRAAKSSLLTAQSDRQQTSTPSLSSGSPTGCRHPGLHRVCGSTNWPHRRFRITSTVVPEASRSGRGVPFFLLVLLVPGQATCSAPVLELSE